MTARRLLALSALAAMTALSAGCMEEVEKSRAARQPVVQLSATAVAFDALSNGSDPAAKTIQISNAGAGTLAAPTFVVTPGQDSTFSDGSPWLTAELTGTAVPYTLSLTATLGNAALGRLVKGTYTATITLTSTGATNSPRTVPVTFVVSDPTPPKMVPSPASVEIAFLTGDPAPADRTVVISNGGQLPLPLPVPTVTTDAADPTWLVATVSGAVAPYTLTIQVIREGLVARDAAYLGRVDLTATGADPVSIPVRLTVSAPKPPQMVLDRVKVTAIALVGGASPPDQQVQVTNGGDLPLQPPAVAVVMDEPTPAWLSATVTGSQPPYTVTVKMVSTGMAARATAYLGKVNLSAPGALPVSIAVELTVQTPRDVTVNAGLTPWTEAGQGTVDTGVVTSVRLLQGTVDLTEFATDSTTPGTWTARLAPGDYWAVVEYQGGPPIWVQSSATTLDLGADVAGRVRVDLAEGVATTLNATNLVPWDGLRDFIALGSWGARSYAAFGPGDGLVFTDDGTRLADYTLVWGDALGGLLAPSDVVYLQQLRLQTSADALHPLDYFRTIKWASATNLTMAQNTPFALDLSGVSPAEAAFQFSWKPSAFEQALPGVVASSSNVHRVSLIAIPAPLSGPAPLLTDDGAGFLLLFTMLNSTGTTGQDFTTSTSMTYGKFPPVGWSELVAAGLTVPVTRARVSTDIECSLPNRVISADEKSATSVDIVPRVTGVTGITINDLDASTPQTKQGTTPRLGWTAPIGTQPTSYRVLLLRLDSTSQGACNGVEVAAFVTTSTNLRVPAGVLEADKVYVAAITARVSQADLAQGKPFRTQVPFGEATVWTETFSTSAP